MTGSEARCIDAIFTRNDYEPAPKLMTKLPPNSLRTRFGRSLMLPTGDTACHVAGAGPQR
jgi:hypothetical protein